MLRKEENFGKLTYECLLKLIEDFHLHIKEKNIRFWPIFDIISITMSKNYNQKSNSEPRFKRPSPSAAEATNTFSSRLRANSKTIGAVGLLLSIGKFFIKKGVYAYYFS